MGYDEVECAYLRWLGYAKSVSMCFEDHGQDLYHCFFKDSLIGEAYSAGQCYQDFREHAVSGNGYAVLHKLIMLCDGTLTLTRHLSNCEVCVYETVIYDDTHAVSARTHTNIGEALYMLGLDYYRKLSENEA